MAKWVTELRKVEFAANVLFDKKFRRLLIDTLEYAERVSSDEHRDVGAIDVVSFYDSYGDLFIRRRIK